MPELYIAVGICQVFVRMHDVFGRLGNAGPWNALTQHVHQQFQSPQKYGNILGFHLFQFFYEPVVDGSGGIF